MGLMGFLVGAGPMYSNNVPGIELELLIFGVGSSLDWSFCGVGVHWDCVFLGVGIMTVEMLKNIAVM